MSTNFYQQNPKKLRSPIFDPICNPEGSKVKKTYYNSQEDNLTENKTEQNQPKLLFTKSEVETISEKKDIINQNCINSLETIFKIASMLILATGGMLTLLEFIIVVRTIMSGSFEFGNNLIVFTVAFIGTLIANLICLGFIHLIKTTKYIYVNHESQRKNREKLLPPQLQ